MKLRFLLSIAVVFFLINNFNARAQPLSTDEVLKEAYAQAARQNKNVFVLFHASWCGWCHKMDTAMNDITVKESFDKNYIIKHLVVYESEKNKELENPGSLDLLTKYKGNDQGIPYWLVFDAKGNLLADSQVSPGKNTGCPATKEEVDHFINVLKKTSRLSENQLTVIKNRFLKNGQ